MRSPRRVPPGWGPRLPARPCPSHSLFLLPPRFCGAEACGGTPTPRSSTYRWSSSGWAKMCTRRPGSRRVWGRSVGGMVPSDEEGVGLVHWRAAATAVALPKPAVGMDLHRWGGRALPTGDVLAHGHCCLLWWRCAYLVVRLADCSTYSLLTLLAQVLPIYCCTA